MASKAAPKAEVAKTAAEISADRKAVAELRAAAIRAADRISFWSAGSGSFTAADLDALRAFAVGGE